MDFDSGFNDYFFDDFNCFEDVEPRLCSRSCPTLVQIDDADEVDVVSLLPGLIGAPICLIGFVLSLVFLLKKQSEVRSIQKSFDILEEQSARGYTNSNAFHMNHDLF